MKSLQDIDANMRLKVHFLYGHLDKFPYDYGDVSDEQRELVYQDITTMDERHQRRWDNRIIDDYCWSIDRD